MANKKASKLFDVVLDENGKFVDIIRSGEKDDEDKHPSSNLDQAIRKLTPMFFKKGQLSCRRVATLR